MFSYEETPNLKIGCLLAGPNDKGGQGWSSRFENSERASKRRPLPEGQRASIQGGGGQRASIQAFQTSISYDFRIILDAQRPIFQPPGTHFPAQTSLSPSPPCLQVFPSLSKPFQAFPSLQTSSSPCLQASKPPSWVRRNARSV